MHEDLRRTPEKYARVYGTARLLNVEISNTHFPFYVLNYFLFQKHPASPFSNPLCHCVPMNLRGATASHLGKARRTRQLVVATALGLQ